MECRHVARRPDNKTWESRPCRLRCCNWLENGWILIIEPKSLRSAFFSQNMRWITTMIWEKNSVRRPKSCRQTSYFARGWTAIWARGKIFRSTDCICGSIWRFSYAQSHLWWHLFDQNQYIKKPTSAHGSWHRPTVAWLYRYSSQLRRSWERANHSCGCQWGLFRWLSACRPRWSKCSVFALCKDFGLLSKCPVATQWSLPNEAKNSRAIAPYCAGSLRLNWCMRNYDQEISAQAIILLIESVKTTTVRPWSCLGWPHLHRILSIGLWAVACFFGSSGTAFADPIKLVLRDGSF